MPALSVGFSGKGHKAFDGSFCLGSKVKLEVRALPGASVEAIKATGLCLSVQSLCSHRLLSTITEPTSGGSCDPPLAEEASSSPLVSEESEMDRTDHGGIKKVCFKVSEEDQEDSGHDTMSYRDSYRWVSPGHYVGFDMDGRWDSGGLRPVEESELVGNFPGGSG